MRYIVFSLVSLLFFAGCQDRKKGSGHTSPGGVYYDYRIWGEEGKEDATLRLQYKTGDGDGKPIYWAPPAKVLLDGAEIKVDSTHFTGVYYELIKPVEILSGTHRIVLLDEAGKEHEEVFDFKPFSLAEELPETLKRKAVQIKLKGIADTLASIRLVMTDTALYSRGINEEITIKNGIINLTERQLANLVNGPVVLEIYREEERPIKGDSKTSGILSITYGLKRELMLVE